MASSGTVYHRLQHSPATFDLVVRLHAEGVSQAGIARAAGISTSTVRRWLERAAVHAALYSEARIRNVDAREVQVDELRSYEQRKQRTIWIYTSIAVWARLWLTALVGRRTVRNTKLHYRLIRSSLSPGVQRPYLTTDAFKYNARSVAETFGPGCVHAQVKKTFKENRVHYVVKKLLLGPQWALDEALARSEDSKTINTSYVERLNLNIRRSLACLQRKTTACVHSAATLQRHLELLRCYYNFVRPHSSLKLGREKRTPAMQAGLAEKPLTWREIFRIPRSELLWKIAEYGYRAELPGDAWVAKLKAMGNNSW